MRPRCRRPRTPPSRGGGAAGGPRPAGHHRRRVPPRLVAPGLPGAARRRDAADNPGPKFKIAGQEQPPIASVTGRVACSRPIMADHFAFLKGVTTRTPKMTIPSPSMLHLRGGRASISRDGLPRPGCLLGRRRGGLPRGDRALYAAGCRYLQLDDITFAYLCDPKIQANCRANGDDPAALPPPMPGDQRRAGRPARRHARDHPHLPRQLQERLGRRGWLRPGGRGDVQRPTSTATSWNSTAQRAGGFEPLRALPAGKKVVLGLVTTKLGDLEDADDAEAPHRRGRALRAAGRPVPVAAVRLLEHPPRQRAVAGRPVAQARAGGRGGPQRSGACPQQDCRCGLRFASPFRCSPPGPGPAAGQSFVGAKRLDQKALCKLSDTSPAPVWHRGGRLACPARTALAGSSAAHSTAVPPRSGLCRADLGQARSRHAGIGAAQQPAERNHR
jgi:hypothetical protein